MSDSLYAYVSITAILAGPILAVLVSMYISKRGAQKSRRIAVFRDLMETRGIRLDPKHVGALNVVELEFYDVPRVRDAFRKYVEHLSAPQPEKYEDQNRFFETRSDIFVNLLQEIGKTLGYKYDKLDLNRNSYVPQGWDADQTLHRNNAHLLNSLLSGKSALPITNSLQNSSQFPEAPKLDG
ncbi:DUF6680 family protein [Celeribacter sp.]|uniref:DUF6680 family protein n=1 Tax=Celeribacter sp. TaxID=1890673 RepID=UPI003A8E41BD